jgi:predicted phosphodiesterase
MSGTTAGNTRVWTKTAVELLSREPDDYKVGQQLGVSAEAVGRKRRRVMAAMLHEDRQDATELRKLVKQSGWMEMVLEAIRDAATPVPALALPRPKYSDDKQEHTLLFSDLQYGELVTLKQTGGLAEYNSDIARERVGELVAQVIAKQKRDKVKRLNVIANGDLVEGHNIYPSQAYHLDQDVVHQAVNGGALFAGAILELSKHYPEVVVDGLIGNHGRFSKESPVMSNMDYMFLKYAEALVSKQKNIRMRVHETWFALIERFGVKYLVAHGDDMALSYEGADKYQRRWRDLVGDFQYVLAGHHHQHAVFTGATWQTIVNGSVVGPSEYSLKSMALGGNAMQTFMTIGPEGVRSVEPLRFTSRAGKATTQRD